MFVRVKSAGKHRYLQIAENYREAGRVRQRILCTLGRLDELTESGTLDSLARSLLRFTHNVKVIDLHKDGKLKVDRDVSIGPTLVFSRLWEQLGIGEVIKRVAADRHFDFDTERAVFLTVLHRLFDPGSDRAAEKWREDYWIPGTETLALHQLYRAMGWLGQSSVSGPHTVPANVAERTTKDRIEELLFARRRELFSTLSMAFFDTTSIYFEGEGGESLGHYGHSKDHRPDLKQIVVGAALDETGRPLACEMFAGNASDVKLFRGTMRAMQARFQTEAFCVVADRGMISEETVSALERPGSGLSYILGCRMRKQKEVREEVLAAFGTGMEELEFERAGSKKPLALQIKEVRIDGRRYILCYNEEQAKKDAASRAAIVESLKAKLEGPEKALIGNKGYRKYLKLTSEGAAFAVDEEKLKDEERYDGKWVLRTNTDYTSEEVVFHYKQLWMVEQAFRAVKSVLETWPIYHKCDDTIRGHVFCSFLALTVMKELLSRLEAKGTKLEWEDIKRDLTALREVELEMDGERYYLRSELRGHCAQVLQAAGVAVPPRVRQ